VDVNEVVVEPEPLRPLGRCGGGHEKLLSHNLHLEVT
jgi:hypothetical protein